VSGLEVHWTHFWSTHFVYAGSLQSVAVVHEQPAPRHGPGPASVVAVVVVGAGVGVPESSASSLGVTQVFREASHT
jgi:hypothetical protein